LKQRAFFSKRLNSRKQNEAETSAENRKDGSEEE
jgi:hypothetical protein